MESPKDELRKAMPAVTFLLLMALAFIATVPELSLAATDDGLLGVIEPISNLFGPIIEQLNSVWGGSPDDSAIFVAKFVLWILLFALLYYPSNMIFKDAGKGVKVAIPFVLALLGTALMPAEILINVMQTYALAGALILWIIPIAGTWFLMHRVPQEGAWKFLRLILYIIIIYLLMNISESITFMLGDLPEWLSYLNLVIGIVTIMFLKELLTIFRGSEAGGDGGSGGGGLFNWWKKKIPSSPQALPDEVATALQGAQKAEKLSKKEQYLLQEIENLEKREITKTEMIINDINKIESALRTGKLDEPVKTTLDSMARYYNETRTIEDYIEREFNQVLNDLEQEYQALRPQKDLAKRLIKVANIKFPLKAEKVKRYISTINKDITNYIRQIREKIELYQGKLKRQLSLFRQFMQLAYQQLNGFGNRGAALSYLNDAKTTMNLIHADLEGKLKPLTEKIKNDVGGVIRKIKAMENGDKKLLLGKINRF